MWESEKNSKSGHEWIWLYHQNHWWANDHTPWFQKIRGTNSDTKKVFEFHNQEQTCGQFPRTQQWLPPNHLDFLSWCWDKKRRLYANNDNMRQQDRRRQWSHNEDQERRKEKISQKAYQRHGCKAHSFVLQTHQSILNWEKSSYRSLSDLWENMLQTTSNPPSPPEGRTRGLLISTIFFEYSSPHQRNVYIHILRRMSHNPCTLRSRQYWEGQASWCRERAGVFLQCIGYNGAALYIKSTSFVI